MRIIDLLNKIARDEEVPKKIKWHGEIYNYYGKDNFYYNNGFSIYRDLSFEGNCLNDEIEIINPEKKIILKNPNLSEPEKKKYGLIEIDIYDAHADAIISKTLCLFKGNAKKCKKSEIDSSHINCFFDHNGKLHFCCKPESINWNDVIYLIYNLAKDGLITEY